MDLISALHSYSACGDAVPLVWNNSRIDLALDFGSPVTAQDLTKHLHTHIVDASWWHIA